MCETHYYISQNHNFDKKMNTSNGFKCFGFFYIFSQISQVQEELRYEPNILTSTIIEQC